MEWKSTSWLETQPEPDLNLGRPDTALPAWAWPCYLSILSLHVLISVKRWCLTQRVVRRIKGKYSIRAHGLVLGMLSQPLHWKYVEPADVATPDGSFLCLQVEKGIQKRFFFNICFAYIHICCLKTEWHTHGVISQKCSPGVNYRLYLTRSWIAFSLVQLLRSCQLLSGTPDLLIWSVVFFWNFWPTALTLEAQPVSIYNRQLYSKSLQKRHSLPCKCTMTPCAQGLLGLWPRPCAPDTIRLETGLQSPSLFVLCLRLLWAVPTWEQREMRFGEGAGDHFPCDSPLFTSMGERRLRGVEVGKIFHYIKRTKEETGSQWPLARPQECANPGNWPLARLLRGCWLGKTGSLTAAKNVDNGLLDILLLKVWLLFYYHQR